LLVRKFDGDVKLPRAVAHGVGAAAGVVVGESGVDVRGETDVVACLGSGTLQNVDASLVFGHPLAKATSVPTCSNTEHAETTNTHHTDGSLCDLSGGEGFQNPMLVTIERNHGRTESVGDGWLAEPKLVRRRHARLRVAERGFGAASFACIHERRLVAQIFTSWNPLTSWMRRIEDFQRAA
jgi:hypothetical protein